MGREEDDEVEFQKGLANLWKLFLTCRVLVIFDLQYVGRFWTSYEFWLSLRTVTSEGLAPTPADQSRVDIECMGAAHEAEAILVRSLIHTWANKDPSTAADI